MMVNTNAAFRNNASRPTKGVTVTMTVNWKKTSSTAVSVICNDAP